MNAPHLWNLLKEHIVGVKIFLPAVGIGFHDGQLKNKETLGYFRGQRDGQNFQKSPRLSI
jgi:hypothetical protein